jgi:hypothetical protein
METVYAKTEPDSSARMHMAYALAKVREDQSFYAPALDFLLEANRIRRSELEFDLTEGERRLGILRDVFTPELMAHAGRTGDPSGAPIFIVGMPRSGTTLTESIIASHHAVKPCGELPVMAQAAEKLKLRTRGQPPLFERIGPDAPFAELARDYLDGARKRVPQIADSERFTDKMPDNFWNVGLIRLAFPNATIIHCRRSAADTCLSIFKTAFGNDGHGYAYDLEELGAYYNLYRAAMRHWEEVLPDGLKAIEYERLVADPGVEFRRLIDMCGLDWDDDCLSFHSSKRVVQTASFYQVRRPIYTSSVNLAERYGDGLKPLLDVLDRKGAA